MNNYIFLTKALIINTFRPISKDSKNLLKSTIFFILIGLTLFPLEIGMVSVVTISYYLLHNIGQEGLVLGLGLSAISSVIFFFGIFYIISVFYFSKDIEVLLPLPLKPREILGAKFTITLLFEYITEIMFFLPIMITYGIANNSGFAYYLFMLIIFLLLPVIPLILASVIDIIIMSFTNHSKIKDRLKLFGGIAAILIAMGLNVFVQRNVSMLNENQLRQLLINGHNSFMSLTSKLFPSAKFGVYALLNSNNSSGLLNLFIFFAINILFLFIFIYIGDLLYFKGAIGSSEVSKRKHSPHNNLYIQAIQRSALVSFISKELKILFRTPIYFINCILMNFIWPAFIFLPVVSQPNLMKNLEKVRLLIQSPISGGIIIAVTFAAGAFLSAANGITSTSISRDGQNIFISKYIPIEFKTQILAKILSGVIMGFFGFIVTFIPAIFLLRPHIYLILLSLIVGIIGLFITAFTGIIIDLNYPKLIWDSEQRAVKQNLNLLLNMLVSAIICGVSFFSIVTLRLNTFTAFVYIMAIFGTVDIILYRIVNIKGKKAFDNIEV